MGNWVIPACIGYDSLGDSDQGTNMIHHGKRMEVCHGWTISLASRL